MTRMAGVSWRMSALLCLIVVFLMSAAAAAEEVIVDCGKKKQSISAALAGLPKQGPHTIRVRGECHELVVIDRRDDLTIVGMDGASIFDPTPEENPENERDLVVLITESSRIQLENLGIYGGSNGVVCMMFSSCRLVDLEVAGATGEGISISRSRGSVEGNTVLRDNGAGMYLYSQSTVLMYNDPGRVTIRDNAWEGLHLQDNSVLLLGGADVIDNGADGISADLGAEFRLQGVTVTGNGINGVSMRSASGRFSGVTITGNGGDGVRVGQLSFAWFAGGANSVTGNDSGTDIHCASATSATVRAIQASTNVGGYTNCSDAE